MRFACLFFLSFCLCGFRSPSLEITDKVFTDSLCVIEASDDPQGRLGRWVDAVARDASSLGKICVLSGKYLNEGESRFFNEDLYITVLEHALSSDLLGEADKMRPRYLLEQAMKNRVGFEAEDFIYTLANGNSAFMSELEADYIILFFNNPDCLRCSQAKAYIEKSSVLRALTKMPGRLGNPYSESAGHKSRNVRLAILAVYPDGDLPLWVGCDYPDCVINAYDASRTIRNRQLYDLRSIPTFYLLDSEKRVLLKNTSVEAIEQWLNDSK